MRRMIGVLVLVVLVALFGIEPVSAHLPGQQATGSLPNSGALPKSGTLPNSSAIQAAVSHTTTMLVTDYQPMMAASYIISDSLSGSIPTPLTWYLDNFDPNHLSNLAVNWAGGGSCTTQPNNDIYCTGTLTQFSVSFNYYDTPWVYEGYIYLGWWGTSTFTEDYTITVTFPDPLVYVGAYSAIPTRVGNRLTWYQADTTELIAFGFFHDPRIKIECLTLIRK
jgi:hypothetical protein